MRDFEPGQNALLIDSKGRRYLVTLQVGGQFHFHRGIVEHDAILGKQEGKWVKSTAGEKLSVLRPTYSDFVLKMPRGAQVVYPKDAGAIIVKGDIHPGARVLEAGLGSGALTMALLRAVGQDGFVTAYEVREDFAANARSNIEAFAGKVENLEIRMKSVFDQIDDLEVDRVVFDLAEPWQALENVVRCMTSGGVLTCYLPTVLQVHQLSESLNGHGCWVSIETTETLVRPWHVEGQSVRPDHRMVAHTGFITVARLVT